MRLKRRHTAFEIPPSPSVLLGNSRVFTGTALYMRMAQYLEMRGVSASQISPDGPSMQEYLSWVYAWVISSTRMATPCLTWRHGICVVPAQLEDVSAA